MCAVRNTYRYACSVAYSTIPVAVPSLFDPVGVVTEAISGASYPYPASVLGRGQRADGADADTRADRRRSPARPTWRYPCAGPASSLSLRWFCIALKVAASDWRGVRRAGGPLSLRVAAVPYRAPIMAATGGTAAAAAGLRGRRSFRTVKLDEAVALARTSRLPIIWSRFLVPATYAARRRRATPRFVADVPSRPRPEGAPYRRLFALRPGARSSSNADRRLCAVYSRNGTL
jgi:hypothetical protein